MRRVVLIALVCIIPALATGIVTGQIVKSSVQSSNSQQARRLFAAQVSACGRGNIRVAAANRNALAEWRLNTLFASALTQPPQQPQTPKQKQLTKNFHGLLLVLVKTLTWTPLNHRCAKNPATVQLPVAFSVRKPTAADLEP